MSNELVTVEGGEQDSICETIMEHITCHDVSA